MQFVIKLMIENSNSDHLQLEAIATKMKKYHLWLWNLNIRRILLLSSDGQCRVYTTIRLQRKLKNEKSISDIYAVLTETQTYDFQDLEFHDDGDENTESVVASETPQTA